MVTGTERGSVRRWRHLGVFLGVSVLAGVLLAGFLLPLVGSSGLIVKAASDHFEDLPSAFQTPSLPQHTQILAADGSTIAQTWGDYGNRVVVPMSQISPNMPNALIAIEDSRYYQHGGIDLTGTVRAFFNDANGGGTQGGSTIAQQYVKNVLLLDAGTNRELQQQAVADTIARKVTELRYAVSVERAMSKEQILENYLNLVYFGNGTYGVQAAAQRYFSTTAAKLTAPQAALLAAIVNSPAYYDPFTHPQNALARRNLVLQKMTDPELHYLTATQAAAAEQAPLGLAPTTQSSGCIAASTSAEFYCNFVYTTFLNDPEFGATPAERQALWQQGGLKISTTMDPVAQNSAATAVSQHTYSTDKVASAIVMIEPGTGRIKAMAQSRPMGNGRGQTFVNLSADPRHNGTLGYQAGSSFKIFTGLAALNKGFDPSLPVNAVSPLTLGGTRLTTCSNGQTSIAWPGSYQPTNDDKNSYLVPMDQAFWYSVNTYFLTLETQTGLCAPAQLAEAMGVTQDNDLGQGKPLDQFASFTLGTNQITPVAMAAAYATVAAQGVYCVPYVITGAAAITGKQYPGQKQQCKQVLDGNTANELTSMLKGVLTQQGATADGLGLAGRDSAGKTGTTDSSVATWFDGYTPQLAAAVWTGFVDSGGGKGEVMANMSVGGQYYSGQIFGATISAPIWQQAMNGALANQPALTFNAPTGFPADQPTTGSPIVGPSPTALGKGRTPISVLPGTRKAPGAPKKMKGKH
ncbi:transglycosylase domain-containing protein [Actinospica sp.]|uniref:transglycosylase domain-containing protein n=1 Tax=Actinospica sp. TaxID=1872142 RepID=UPI002C050482|nr:transglycosylase domain-containing protein [Actinospica sp.]HWG23426.1 transglycosylase domain-containing protein [Actinospica sp.]